VPKTVVFLASGTRGDVQPYLALALGLKAAGLRAVVATHLEFRPLVEGAGLPFALLDGNPSAWMTRAGGQSALTYDGDLLRSARATLAYLQAVRPLFARLLTSAREAARGADVLVAGLATSWGLHLAEALRVPCLWAFLQPVARTRLFPSALLPFRFSLGGEYNMLTHRLIEQIMWQPWRRQLNTWRTQMGLRPAPFWGLADRLHTPAAGVMVGVSPSVLPRPADWPAGHAVTGYWFQDVDPGWTPPLDLARFIEAGRVVSIGFGSPGVLQARRTLDLVMRALVLADLRAVVALPRELAGLNLPERVLPVEAVPHHWLFPRVRAAVHHGGAGTTGYSLRAGTPTVILPLAIDQFFWGERVAALKVGPRPMPQRTLTAGALAAALCQAVEDAALRGRAQALGAAIRAEDGVGRALDFIRARL
jgi:UDP:flavonoid glycosyltransferase YjiC (YdhE family)